MEGLLSNFDAHGGQRVRESQAIAYWPAVVGPQAAEASEAENVRDGTLFVRTRSSVWSQELTFLKSTIVAELNRRIGKPVIREIVFRAQGVRKKAREEEPKGPSDDDLEAVILSAADREALESDTLRLTGITDPRLRISLARRMLRDRKLRRWRLDHGWHACTRCAALHSEAAELCPICRVCG
jgi:predicted nucleic acid-binding Zn ribbon protein